MTLEDVLIGILFLFVIWLYSGSRIMTPKVLRELNYVDKDEEEEEE